MTDKPGYELTGGPPTATDAHVFSRWPGYTVEYLADGTHLDTSWHLTLTRARAAAHARLNPTPDHPVEPVATITQGDDPLPPRPPVFSDAALVAGFLIVVTLGAIAFGYLVITNA